MRNIFMVFLFFQSIYSQANWYKGNLHTHSLWSDGDDFPEMVVDWYKNSGYDFVALSDHNVIAEGERWININSIKEGGAARDKYLARFGDDWVELREDSVLNIRLKTFDEYKTLMEEPGKFLIIKSEEISDRFEKKPIHINATNIQQLIEPQGGGSVYEVMQNNVDAINDQREKSGSLVMPHINHPNFIWSVTAEDLIKLKGDKLFEIYNGHPLVNNYGDSIHVSTERMWDIVLTERLTAGSEIMYGIAVDDAHNYFTFDSKQSNPGRGWIMVKADSLTPETIINSMEEGNFYSSSGVEISDLSFKNDSVKITIAPEQGITYTTQFIGTKINYKKSYEEKYDSKGERITGKYSSEIGIVLSEVNGVNPIYKITGEEIYIRAKITSSKKKENPYQPDEFEAAWIQPVHNPDFNKGE